MSDAFTARFPVVSPNRTPIVAETEALIFPATPVALFKVTVTFWAFVAPVKFTIY